MRAEPGWYSPFGEGDTISILKDGETVFSYIYGTGKFNFDYAGEESLSLIWWKMAASAWSSRRTDSRRTV